MILARRCLPCMSQDEIGWELGLIVPPGIETAFTKVRTGVMPPAGYGTQTSKPEFSIASYFKRHRLPLGMARVLPSSLEEFISTLDVALEQDSDVILCFDSRRLFGDGDREHVALIEGFNRASGLVTLLDPALDAPGRRTAGVESILATIQSHALSTLGGLWIISEAEPTT